MGLPPGRNIEVAYRVAGPSAGYFGDVRLGGLSAKRARSRRATHQAVMREGPADASDLPLKGAGGASLSVDPLSSQSVRLAIASGIRRRSVVNTPRQISGKIPRGNAHSIGNRQKGKDSAILRQDRRLLSGGEFAIVCDQRFWRQRATSTGDTASPVVATEKLDYGARIQLSGHGKG